MSPAGTEGAIARRRSLAARIRGLYAVTPELDSAADLIARVNAALVGGASAVQYRNKSLDMRERHAQAVALARVVRARGALFIINDDVELAAAVDADGVHLGEDDGSIERARSHLGPDRIVGISCYNDFARAEAAVADGADYVAFGSFYSSSIKPDARRADPSLLQRAQRLDVPVVAIGGITPGNAGDLARAGADAVAVISAVFGSSDVAEVEQAARAVSAAMDKHEPPRSDRSTADETAPRTGSKDRGAGPECVARTGRNEELFARAQRTIPAGVNSPVRAFRSVGGTPRFFVRGAGAYLWDADGKRYIDYVGSWGPAILGHAHPATVSRVQEAAAKGLSFGAPTESEIEMAETLCRLVPSMAMVRLVSSGTEATMSALRLARGYTGRSRIMKFEGCYHGHGDSLLVKAGSGALTFGQPSSAGVPAAVANETIVVPYNDLDAVEKAFATDGVDIACIIVEPVAGNMNLIVPHPQFLRGLRDVCNRYGAVLIFDEVMTGFRVHLSGAQGLYGVTPDLTTLGKIIGGGMPVGAFGGRREIMERIAPLGPVYQAGTLSGNPVAVAAGLATLEAIQAPGFYEQLSARTRELTDGLTHVAKNAGVAFCAQGVGGMFGFYFSDGIPDSFATVMACDKERFNRFFHAMLDGGVYFAPSAFEAGFVSAAHTSDDIAATLALAEKALAELTQ